LPVQRAAAAFEALTERAASLAEDGRPPTVVVATLGEATAVRAELDFVDGFFAAGGIATSCLPADGSVAGIAAALARVPTPAAVVVVGSAPRRAVDLSALVRRLEHAGVARIYAAGRPPTDADAAEEPAVRWIARGSDIVTVLDDLLTQLDAQREAAP
jgi:methylmalonyl-CoA mutase cobalamin-binding subunit